MEMFRWSSKLVPKLMGGVKTPMIRNTGRIHCQGLKYSQRHSSLLLQNRGFASQQSEESENESRTDEEFRPLDIIRSKARVFTPRKKRERKEIPPPRYLKMPTDQDWPSVWPTPKTFHPASVPLPLHQGYVDPTKAHPTPNKWANLELMKIPNFLHLTPPAIKRHCEALKKFCTPWPKELNDDYVLENLFPIEVVTNDYCHSSPSIRESKARIVTLKIKVSFLKLDERAKDKFLRLVGDRYNSQTDELVLVTDCCPLKKQNYDYSMYLLTALYHESWNKETWEADKSEADMEKYTWEGSKSEQTLRALLGKENLPTEIVDKYKDATTKIHNEGESSDNLIEYGNAVRQLLIPSAPLASKAA